MNNNLDNVPPEKRSSSRKRGIPTYQGQLLQVELTSAQKEKQSARQEKEERQKVVKLSLSALIKRAIKARSELLAQSSDDSKLVSPFPVPLEFVEALKMHCAHHARSFDEETIFGEFYSVLEKEISMSHAIIPCLFLLDTFVHSSIVFRSIVAKNANRFISACEKANILQLANESSYLKECRDYLLEIVDLWSLECGGEYKSFTMLKRFLRETLLINAPKIEDRITTFEKSRKSKELSRWESLVSGTERVVHKSWPEARVEISNIIQRVEESFQSFFQFDNVSNRTNALIGVSSTAPVYLPSEQQRDTTIISSKEGSDGKSFGLPYSTKNTELNSTTATAVNSDLWEQIEWESDEPPQFDGTEDSDSLTDLYGEDLILASAAFTGDIRIVIDPHAIETNRGVSSSEERKKREQFRTEILKAVSTAAQHLVSLYKLIAKWNSLLRAFLAEVERAKQDEEDQIQFWMHHKKRRKIIIPTADASLVLSEEKECHQEDKGESDQLMEYDQRKQNILLNGKDRALLERLQYAANILSHDEIPAVMQTVRSLVENQIRSMLSNGL